MPHPLCILLVGALLLTFAAGIKDATLSFSTARTRALIEFAVGEGEEDRSVSLSLEITSGLTLQKEVSCTLSDSSAAPIDIPCSVSAGTLTASVDLADVASGQGVLAVRFDHTPVLFPDPQTVKATLSQDSVLVATFTDVPLQLTETLTSPTATAELFEAADGTSAFVVSLTELGGGVENDTFVVTDVVLSNPLLPSSTWAPANCAWVEASSHFLPSLLAPAAGAGTSSLGPSALVSLQKPSVVGAIAPGRVVCAEVAGLNALQFTDGFSPLTVTLLRRSADGTPQSQLVMTVPLPEPVPAPTSVTVITRVSTASPLSEPLAGVAADLLSGPLPHLLSLGGSVTVGTLFAQSYAALPGLSTPQSLSAALTLALGDGGDGPGAVTATTEQHPAGEYRCETGASSSGPQEGCLSLCRAAGVCTLLPSSEGSGQEAASTNSCAYSLKPAADSTGCTHKWGCGSAASPRPCTSAHLRCGPRSSAVCGPQTWVLDVLCVETAAEKEVAHSRCAPFPAPTLPEGHGVGDACEVSKGCEHRCRPEAGRGPAFECADSRSWACAGSSQDTPPLEGASRRFLTLGEEEDTCGLACSSRARSVFCVDPSSGSEVSASLCTAPAPANTADQGAFGSCSQAALGTLTLEWQRGGSGDVDALAVPWSGGTNLAPQPHTMLVHIIPPTAAAALFPNPGPLVCTDPASGATIACSGPSADGVLTVSLPSLAPAGSLTIALPRSAAGAGHVRGVKAVATVAVAESAAAAAAAAGDESLTGDFAVASAVGDVGIVPLDESEADAWFVPASSKGASDALLGTLTVALSGTGMLASAGGADIHAVSVTLPPGWSLDDAPSAECSFSCGESAPLWPFTAPWEVTTDVVFIPRVLTASFTSSVPVAAGCVSLFLACTGLVAPVQDAGIPISLEFDAGSLLHVVPQVLVQQVSLAAAPALLAVVIDDQDSAFTLADVMGSFASESVSTALATGVLIAPGPSARALLTLVSTPGLAALSSALAPVTIEDARVRAQAERACRFPDSAAALLSSQAAPGGSAIWLACDSGCGEPVRDVCRLGGQTADPSDVDMCALEPAPPAAPAPCAPTVTSGGVSFGDDVLTVTYATNGDFFGPTALVWAVEGLAEVAELDSLPECPADPSVPCQAAGLVLVPTTGDTLHAGAPAVVPLPVARAARRLPVALSLRGGSGNGSVLWTWQGVVDVNVRELTADALRFVWQEEGTLIALLTLPEDDGGLLIDTIQVTPPSGVSLSLSPSSPATVCSVLASEAATTPFWPWSASLVSAHTTAADTVTTLSVPVPVSGRLLAIVLTGAQIDANPAPQSVAALFLVASANKTVGYAVTHTVDAPVSEPAPPSPGVLSLLFAATNPSLPSVEAAAAAIGAPVASIAVAAHSSGLTVAVDVPASLSWATAIASSTVLSSALSGVALDDDAEFDPSGTALLPYGAWSCPGSNLPASGGSACPTRVDGDCGGFLPELAECVSEDAQASAVQCAFVPRPAVETAGCAPKVLSFSFTSIAPLSVSGGISAPPAGMGSYALTFGYTSSEREHFLVAPEGLALRLHLPASLSTPAGVALAGCANGNGHALVCDVSEEDDVAVVTVRVPNSRRDGVITLPLAARGASSVSLAVAAAPNSPVAYSGPSAVVLGDLLYASVPAALFSAQLVPVGAAAVEGDQPTTGTLSLVAGSDTLLALPPLETFFADSFTHVHVFLSSAALGTPTRCFATAAATSSPSSPLAAWPLSAASLFRTNGPDTVTTGGSLSARLPLALSDGATMVTLLCAGLPLLPSAAHASGDVVLELIDSASGHVLRLSPPSASLTYDPLAAPPRAQVLLAGFTADPAPADPATVAAALESAVVADAASEVEVLVDVSEAGEVSVAVKTKDDAWGLVDALVLLNGTHSVLSLLEAELSSIASTAASAATTVTLVPDSVLSGLEGALLCADAAAPHSFAVCAVPGDCGHEYQGPVRCVDTAAAAGESPAQGAAGVDARWCSFLPPVPPAPVVIDRCEPTFALISASFIEGDRPEEDGMLELGVVVSDASQFVGVRAYEIVLVDTKNVFSFANISCNATSFDSPDDDDDDGLLVQGQSCSSSGNELRVSLTNLAGDVIVQVTGVGVTAWSRKAILSATATVDADDSNIFVGDPAVVVGPVGVSSFTAPSALAEFVATNASHSNEGALLVSLVVHGGFLLNDSVTTAHITLPPGWTVTGCSVAACAPGPQHWPFSLTSPITMANTELKGDVYSVGLPSNWHGPGSIWVLCDMVTPSAESKGAVSVALSKKTRLYDHSASLPIESKPAAATDIDSYVSFVLKTSVEVAIVSPEALSKAAGVGAISRSVGSYKLRITMRLKGLNRVFRLVLMVPEVIEGFLAAASTRDGLAALSGELESNPPPQRGHIGSWLCGAQAGSSSTFGSCVVSNLCGTQFNTTLHCVVNDVNTSPYSADEVACSFDSKPVPVSKSGCGSFKCRDPLGDLVDCNHESICHHDCSVSPFPITTADHSSSPFAQYCIKNGVDANPAEFCPADLISPAPYASTCVPRTACAWSCFDSQNKTVPCANDAAWGPCSSTCGPGTRTRNLACSAPNPEVGVALEVLDAGMCAFTALTIPKQEDCSSSSCVDHSHKWLCAAPGAGSGSNTFLGDMYDSCDVPGGMWSDCSVICGSGRQSRTVKCALVGKDNKIGNTSEPPENCGSKDTPASTKTCLIEQCPGAEWRCAMGGNTATPCGDWPVCPTTGCGIKVQHRDVGCYVDTSLVHEGNCTLSKPDSRHVCGRLTDACVADFTGSTCTYDKMGQITSTLDGICVSSGDDAYRLGKCVNAAGRDVDDDLCGQETLLQKCNLPPCTSIRYVWGTGPEACGSKKGFCETFIPRSVKCYAVAPGWPTVTVNDGHCAAGQKPAPVAACATMPCLSGGTCEAKSVVYMDVEYPNILEGKCKCPLGTGGSFCETALVLQNVKVSVAAPNYRITWTLNTNTINVPAVVELSSTSLDVPLMLGSVNVTMLSFSIPILDVADIITPGLHNFTVTIPTSRVSAAFEHVPPCNTAALSCANGGRCDSKTGRCKCLGDFQGRTCNDKPCDRKGCNLDGSTCDDSTGTAICSCSRGPNGAELLMGELCDTPVNGCPDAGPTCLNGGKRAVSVVASEVVCGDCKCKANFAGPSCGSCRLNCERGSPDSTCSRCLCPAGYQGKSCECRYALMRFLLVTSGDLEWLPNAGSSPSASVWALNVQRALVSRLGADATTDDVLVEINDSKFVTNSSGVGHVEVTVRFDGPCGLGQSMEDVHKAMNLIKDAFLRGDLAREPAFLGLVAEAGVGLDDPNCQPSILECPSNVGRGGVIAADNSTSPGGDSGSNGPDPKPPKGKDDDDDSPSVGIVIAIVIGIAVVVTIAVVAIAWKMGVFCFKPGTPATFAPGQKGRSYYDV